MDVTVNDLEVTSKKHAVSNIFAVDRSEQISNDLNRLSIADEGDDGNIGKMHFCGSGKLNEREVCYFSFIQICQNLFAIVMFIGGSMELTLF